MKLAFLILMSSIYLRGTAQINTPDILRKNKVYVIIENSVSSKKSTVPTETHTYIDSLGLKIKRVKYHKNSSNDSSVTFFTYDPQNRLIKESTTSNYGVSYEDYIVDSNTYMSTTTFNAKVDITKVTTKAEPGKDFTYLNDTLAKIHYFKDKKYNHVCKMVYYKNGRRSHITHEKHYSNKAGQRYKLTARTRGALFAKHKKRYRVNIHYFYYMDGLLQRVTDYHSSDHAIVTSDYRYLKRE